MRWVMWLLVLVFAGGCDSSPKPKKSFNISIPDNLSPEAKTLVTQSWPKVKEVCPGLDKYGGTLKFVQIEDNLKFLNKVTVEILVPDGSSEIPGSYRAWGHHCFLDIASDGKSVGIAKRPCKAVCLDQVVDGTANDNGNDMVLYFK